MCKRYSGKEGILKIDFKHARGVFENYLNGYDLSLIHIWIPSRNLSVFISFLMVFPVVYTNILEGIRQTDKQLLEMADSFGAGVGKKLQFIYLSQVMPYAVTACKLGIGLCWKAGIAAEVIGIL